MTITAEDGFDHPDASFDGEVTLILAANPGDGTLGGGFSMTAGNGVATFSNVTIDSAGVGYVLAASGTDLVARMTAPFNVAAEQATQLVVTTEPAPDDLAHNPFAVVVSAEDAFGNVDPTFSGLVTLTPGNNPAGATLGGVFAMTAVNGVARFSGPILDQVGNDDTLVAQASGVAEAKTSSFNVTTSTEASITIDINYSYDTSGFFTANPQAKVVLQEAAQILGSGLHDSLAAIAPDPSLGESWTAVTFNPSDPGEDIDINNLSVPDSTIVVYVGASVGDYGGLGGPGGYEAGGTSTWQNLVGSRASRGPGESSDRLRAARSRLIATTTGISPPHSGPTSSQRPSTNCATCWESAPRSRGSRMSTARPQYSPAPMPIPRRVGSYRSTRARASSSAIPTPTGPWEPCPTAMSPS